MRHAVPLILALALFAPTLAALPGGVLVVAAGGAEYVYDNDGPTGSCAGRGEYALRFDPLTRRVQLVGHTVECPTPLAVDLTDCRGTVDGPVECVKDFPTVRIRLTLTEDGELSHYWAEGSFVERLHGRLTRL